MNSPPRAARAPGALTTLLACAIAAGAATALLIQSVGGAHASASISTRLGLGLFLSITLLLGAVLARRMVAGPPAHASGAKATQATGESGEAADSADFTLGRDRFFRRLVQVLSNPLAAALAELRSLRAHEHEPSPQASLARADALERIERCLRQQASVISALEEASRPLLYPGALPATAADLTALVEGIVEAYRPAIEERGLRIQTLFQDRPMTAYADPRRLEQAMGALLSNATRFTPAGGLIRVRLASSEEHVTICVSDTGVGFTADASTKLFDPILREESFGGPAAGGLGLGLAVANRLVMRQGGSLSARSDGPGKGASFCITLPRSRSAATPDSARRPQSFASSGRPASSLGRLEQVRLLLVDDEFVVSESLQVLLEACGAEVRAASSATQARRILEVWHPDVIIADLGMPGEDGYGLLASIRGEGAGAGGAVPMIALTGRDGVEEHMKTMSAGFQGFLAKPADPRELVAVVRDLCGRFKRDEGLTK